LKLSSYFRKPSGKTPGGFAFGSDPARRNSGIVSIAQRALNAELAV
jgi:hypothetical protein